MLLFSLLNRDVFVGRDYLVMHTGTPRVAWYSDASCTMARLFGVMIEVSAKIKTSAPAADAVSHDERFEFVECIELVSDRDWLLRHAYPEDVAKRDSERYAQKSTVSSTTITPL